MVIGWILDCVMMRLRISAEVLKYSESGIPYVGLSDLLHLPNISRVCGDICDEAHLSDRYIVTLWRCYICVVFM